MRVAFLTHYYPPERGAPQTRLSETVAGLKRLGVEATVITGPPHYPRGRVLDGRPAWRPHTDLVDGVVVHRLPMIPRPNDRIFDRVVDQGSFAATAILAAPIIRQNDVFVVESPPLFLGMTAALLHAVTRRPYVYHVADPWPDFPIAAGVLKGRIPIGLALWLEELAYRRAALITTVTPPLVDRLSRKPGAAGKVRLLPNSVDLDRFHPELEPAAARAELGWEQGFTLVYSGTVGLAQGLGTLLEAASRLRDLDIWIRVVGDGVELANLRERAQREGLTRVVFEPAVPANEIPTVLAAADAILVLLRRGPLYDEALPTKLVEGLAAGRALVVSADGYAARVVRDRHAGETARAEDPTALSEAIRAIAQAQMAPIRRAARELASTDFGRVRAVSTLEHLLASVARP